MKKFSFKKNTEENTKSSTSLRRGLLSKKQDTILTFILVFIILVLVNALVYQFTPVFDFTRDKVYSLSKESKLLVRSFNEPVTIKLFITPNLPPPFSTYEKYVKDLLSQYKAASRGKLKIEVIDASKTPTEARDYGIAPSQINVLEKDQTQMKVAYLGLSFIYGKSFEVIPFVGNTEGLEYAMSTTIKKLIEKNDRLANLKDNINVYYVASQSIEPLLPVNAYQIIPGNIMQAISEANKELKDKVVFHNIDPYEATNEALLKKLGVEKIKWDDIKDASGNIITKADDGYFSFVLEHGENIKHINNVLLVQGSISDITTEIKAATENALDLIKTVGYIEGHGEPKYYFNPPEYGGTQQEAFESIQEFANAVNASYTFEPINISMSAIPPTINALIVVGPKSEYHDSELYKIDQFIMQGKPVMFLLNSTTLKEDNDVITGNPVPVILEANTKITDMLASYGLSISRSIVFDENCYKAQPNPQTPPQNVYYIPLIQPENINAKNDITKNIKLLFAPFSSEIVVPDLNKNTKVTPLAYTSKKSWTADIGFTFNNIITPPTDKDKLSKRLISASLEGELKSYFTNGVPDSYIDNNILAIKTASHLSNTSRAKIFLSTSVDMAKNSAFAPNSVFLLNALDWLVSDAGGFMSIRRKGVVYNPPYQVGEIFKGIIRGFNIVVVPALVILCGVLLWTLDKKRRLRIKKKFEKTE